MNAPLGHHPPFPLAPHDPFYDITYVNSSSSCTGNNVDPAGYCAGPGYDEATGWGSANMLQLAWAYNWYLLGYDAHREWTLNVGYEGGVAPNTWFNTSPMLTVLINFNGGSVIPSVGVAGFSSHWDSPVVDAVGELTPGFSAPGTNAFYDGPQVTSNTGIVDLSTGGQGCHTLHVLAWDNSGLSSGDQTVGPFCYDSFAPGTQQVVTPSPNAGGWNNTAVTATLIATDTSPGSGLQFTYYAVDNSGCSRPIFTSARQRISPGLSLLPPLCLVLPRKACIPSTPSARTWRATLRAKRVSRLRSI